MTPTYQELLDIKGRIIEGDLERALLQLRFFELTDEAKNWIRKELEGYGKNDDLPEYRRDILIARHDPNDLLGPDYPKTTDMPSPLSYVLDHKDKGIVYGKTAFYNTAIPVSEVHKVVAAVEGIVTDFVATALEGYDGKNANKISVGWEKAGDLLHQLSVGVISSIVAGQI